MLQPKRTKYRKSHKLRSCLHGMTKGGADVSHGTFGIRAMTPGFVTARQIESARRTIRGTLKRGGKLWIKAFPHMPVTLHPAETRMGKGKGGIDHYAQPVRPGFVLFELGGVTEELAREAFRLAGHKLPVKTTFVSREF